MTILKLASTEIGDLSLLGIAKIAPFLEHIELQKCEKLTEYSIKNIFELNLNLKFLDINKIPIVNYAFLDEIK